MKPNRFGMERKEVGKLTKDEALVLQLLETMQQEKDPLKWHENIFGHKRCKQSSVNPQELQDAKRLVSLIKEHHKLIEEGSSSMVSNIHSLENDNHVNANNTPYLPPFRFLKVLKPAKPIEKRLTKSDVTLNLNRLLLKKEHVENFFLPLLRNGENISTGIEVSVYDMHGIEYTMTFKIWAEKYYVLTGEWKDLFQNNALQSKDLVTVWMCRHSATNKLCFAISFKKLEE